ncbi:hypothetical protein [Pseudomonas sp.]|uniref:hypothetical protein n=1 Tax=Pseudomonas sp. TaxID=306 RepID=UPI003A96EBC5
MTLLRNAEQLSPACSLKNMRYSLASRDSSPQGITDIRHMPSNMELEPLAQGVSGRMSKRAACTYACRWQYKALEGRENKTGKSVAPESRPSCHEVEPSFGWMRRLISFICSKKIIDRARLFRRSETSTARSAYITNAKDLRVIRHVEQRAPVGVCSRGD